jgi:hypothetical protein
MSSDAQIILTAVISALSSSGVMSVILYLIQRRDREKEKEELNKSVQTRMLLSLGHDKIVYLTDKFVRRGAITLKEKRNLEFLAKPYFEAGGNGDGKIGYEACQKLMVVPEESADFMDIEIKRKEYGFENVEQHV